MMTDEDLREQRRGEEVGLRRGSRAVEKACQAAVLRCWRA